MFRRFVKLFKSIHVSSTTPGRKPRLSALAHLDRNALEDIGVSPAEVAMSSPLKAARWDAGVIARWDAGVIASGHSARWSLSSDWERLSEKNSV